MNKSVYPKTAMSNPNFEMIAILAFWILFSSVTITTNADLLPSEQGVISSEERVINEEYADKLMDRARTFHEWHRHDQAEQVILRLQENFRHSPRLSKKIDNFRTRLLEQNTTRNDNKNNENNRDRIWKRIAGERVAPRNPILDLTTADKSASLGLEAYQRGNFEESIKHWQNAARLYWMGQSNKWLLKTLLNLASAHQTLGHSKEAISILVSALGFAREVQDYNAIVKTQNLWGNILVFTHEATLAEPYLQESLDLARQYGYRDVEIVVLNDLGRLFAIRSNGLVADGLKFYKQELRTTAQSRFEQASSCNDDALKRYNSGLSLAEELDDSLLFAKLSTNKATLLAEQMVASTEIYNVASSLARRGAKKNAGSLMSDAQKFSNLASDFAGETLVSIGHATEGVSQLPPSHDKASLLITIGQLYERVIDCRSNSASEVNEWIIRAYEVYQQARGVAELTKDQRNISFSLGYMGHMYELEGSYTESLMLTRQAAYNAQNFPEVLYLWQWQMGRIHQAQNDIDFAIRSYSRAVEILQSIRHDIAIRYGNRNTQFSFREIAGKLYFQLADLLLQEGKLFKAREIIQRLKSAELEDYFQDDCVSTTRFESMSALQSNEAAIYIVPFPDRIDLLVGYSKGMDDGSSDEEELALFRMTDAGVEELEHRAWEFRNQVQNLTSEDYLASAQTLYSWLIQPILEFLIRQKIDTLIFIPDGALFNIPFAALHDGQKFLIQEFAIAITPRLEKIESTSLKREHLNVLLCGMTNDVEVDGQHFPALEQIENEFKCVEDFKKQNDERPQYIGSTKVLLDQDFEYEQLRQELGRTHYSIVHIASHGEFTGDVRDSFVITGGKEKKLSANDFERLIRPGRLGGRPVELLILNGCSTAVGDDRAALGLAGIAVKAGTRSVLATSWRVLDQFSPLFMTEFYRELERESLAKAVQSAQKKMLDLERGEHPREFRHPGSWSAYLVIGNWL